MTLGVYRFYCDFRRMGDLSGVFLATKEQISEAIGKTAYFGEVLGKHSDVYCELEDDMITLITEDPQVVKIIDQYDLVNGYNPLSYIDQDE